jgi:hypothetical protein
MSRRGVAVGIAILGLLLPQTAFAATPENDYAKGTAKGLLVIPAGVQPALSADLTFNAVSDFNGFNPRGTAKYAFESASLTGTVTCLEVNGNMGVVEGWVTGIQGPNPFTFVPKSFQITAVDGDDASDPNGVDTLASEIQPSPPSGIPGGACLAAGGPQPIGEVTVHDAEPLLP